MSEYQYYEFLAIDRPLTSKEMEALRALSTRAHISPVSFTNEYHWGDFHADPYTLMERFFDAHVYVANWMTAIFMLRVPIDAISKKTAKTMAVRYLLDFKATKTDWIITWSLEQSENYDRFGMEDGRGWMAQLAPVRDELLRGDVRSLYIGWLAAVTSGTMDDDSEPLPVKGLGSLTAAQQALAEFLDVDQALLAGAGMGSPAIQDEGPPQREIDEWLKGMPQNEVMELLKQLLAGKGQQAERRLRNRFAAWRRGLQGERTETPRRTVGELRENAELAEKARLEQAKRERKRREIKRRKERETYLKNLSKDFPKTWQAVQQTIQRGPAWLMTRRAASLLTFPRPIRFTPAGSAFNKS
ncbi:MAG: hypothetical protein SWQ30_17190 [Thermodesulfobacteriota bacterium]|nr:hypothetical protein [Thermodesulfobacteriota bacterium]